jgi:hypothetical protein
MLGCADGALTVPESDFKLAISANLGQQPGQVDCLEALNWLRGDSRFRTFYKIELTAQTWTGDRPARTYGELVDWVFRQYGRAHGREGVQAWVDHTPGNIFFTRTLLELFPNAKIVHMVRDGRAVARSLLDRAWGPNTMYHAANWWARYLAAGLAAEQAPEGEHILRVHYEDLVLRPEETLRGVCAFTGLVYNQQMIQGPGFEIPSISKTAHPLIGKPPDPRRINLWRQQLTPRQVEIFEALTGDLLPQLGYPSLYGATAQLPSLLEMAMMDVLEKFGLLKNHLRYRLRTGTSTARMVRPRRS